MDKTSAVIRSSPMVHAPGMAAYLVRAYKTDQAWAFNSLATTCPTMPMWAADKLFKGEYEIDGEDVIINYKEDDNE